MRGEQVDELDVFFENHLEFVDFDVAGEEFEVSGEDFVSELQKQGLVFLAFGLLSFGEFEHVVEVQEVAAFENGRELDNPVEGFFEFALTEEDFGLELDDFEGNVDFRVLFVFFQLGFQVVFGVGNAVGLLDLVQKQLQNHNRTGRLLLVFRLQVLQKQIGRAHV